MTQKHGIAIILLTLSLVTAAGAQSRPHIERVFHSGTSSLNAGDYLDVVVIGDPGLSASFEILGSLRPQALRETQPGRYETRYTIPNGLQVERGVVVGYLTRNGLQAALEADRPVTIGVRSGNDNDGRRGRREFDLEPDDGATVSSRRPVVKVRFPRKIRDNSTRLFVDSIDFSRQVKELDDRTITWMPTYDLAAGQHRVEVEALAGNGRTMNEKWTFTIGDAPTQLTVTPADGQSGTYPRPTISAKFPQPMRNLQLFVDNKDFTNSSKRDSQNIAWTPGYDLSAGQHTAQAQGLLPNGQLLVHRWTFTIAATDEVSIQSFTITPQTAQTGQTIVVSFSGPAGGTASFDLGGRQGIPMSENQKGRYSGSYTVAQNDAGNLNVVARLRMPDGRTATKTSTTPVQVNTQPQAALTVSNLRDGMALPQNFNVQGTGRAGATVTVTITYAKGDILGTIAGQTKQFSATSTVRSNGTYDVGIEASRVPSGSNMRIVVSDSYNSSPVTLNVKKQ